MDDRPIVPVICGVVGAAALVAVCELFGIQLDEAAEAEVTAALVVEACIAQFGPGERWYRHTHVYECVTSSGELPSHVLTSPVGLSAHSFLSKEAK